MVDESAADSPLSRARERRHGLRSAMSAVEHALAAPPSARVDEWVTAVCLELEGLRAAFERHVANAEEHGGLLEEVIDHAPRLVNRVNKLRDDHATLATELAALAHRLDDPLAADTIGVVRDEGIELLAHFAHHRQLGSDLVYEAFNVDIEAAD